MKLLFVLSAIFVAALALEAENETDMKPISGDVK